MEVPEDIWAFEGEFEHLWDRFPYWYQGMLERRMGRRDLLTDAPAVISEDSEMNEWIALRRRWDAGDLKVEKELMSLKDKFLRNVRYYAAEGVISEMERHGRNLHYTAGHAVQLLIAFHLRREHGMPLPKIRMAIRSEITPELEARTGVRLRHPKSGTERRLSGFRPALDDDLLDTGSPEERDRKEMVAALVHMRNRVPRLGGLARLAAADLDVLADDLMQWLEIEAEHRIDPMNRFARTHIRDGQCTMAESMAESMANHRDLIAGLDQLEAELSERAAASARLARLARKVRLVE
jgi:DNA-binding transcriptional MerR regulator